jgi:hypothetical protein
MSKTLAVTVSLLFLVALVFVNVQYTSAQSPCTTQSCGAGDFVTGGVNGLTCSAGLSCWWNECNQRAGQCVTSFSQQCSSIGPIGCPHAPCAIIGQPCDGDGMCCHGLVCGANDKCASGTPLMINLKNNSSNFHLTSYNDGVSFDINATGVPLQVGWTEAGSQIAILVLDRNGNGSIDDGSELFGNATKKRDGSPAAHGFDALVDLDGGADVSDGRIDANDADYARLRLWLDDNHDGISQANELVPLADAGISALFTAYEETPRMDHHGNLYKFEGSVLVVRNGREHKRRMFDVFLITAPASS